MNAPVPTLSQDGWVTDPNIKGDYLLSHFFLSEYSQTQLYPNNVSSLPWLIQNNQGNNNALQNQAEDMLSSYFSRYFTQVDVQVSINQDPANNAKSQLNFYVSYNDETGKRISLGKSVSTNNSKIENIIAINNG